MELFSQEYWDSVRRQQQDSNGELKAQYNSIRAEWLLPTIGKNVTREEYKTILTDNKILFDENERGFRFTEQLKIQESNRIIHLHPTVSVIKIFDLFSQSLTFTEGEVDSAKVLFDIFKASGQWIIEEVTKRKQVLLSNEKTIRVSFEESYGGSFHDELRYVVYFKIL